MPAVNRGSPELLQCPPSASSAPFGRSRPTSASAPAFIVEEALRGVSLGKDTFATGRIGPAPMEAALQALDGFKRLMDGYRVQRYRAVATSAVREAANADTFLDRVSVRTGPEPLRVAAG